jgi:hypothetical protein
MVQWIQVLCTGLTSLPCCWLDIFIPCRSTLLQPMPVLPEPVDAQQEQQLQQELAELREQLMQVGARCSC